MKLWSVLGNSQKLDGGAMFGNAPRAMWTKWVAPDEENRIPLACRGGGGDPPEGDDVADRDATHTQHPRRTQRPAHGPSDDRDISTVRLNLP